MRRMSRTVTVQELVDNPPRPPQRLGVAAVGLLTVIAAGVLWVGGEEHLQSCLAAKKTRCSRLPWKSGDGHRVPVVKIQESTRPFGAGDPYGSAGAYGP